MEPVAEVYPGTTNVIIQQLALLLQHLGVDQLKREGKACGQQSLDKHTLAFKTALVM